MTIHLEGKEYADRLTGQDAVAHVMGPVEPVATGCFREAHIGQRFAFADHVIADALHIGEGFVVLTRRDWDRLLASLVVRGDIPDGWIYEDQLPQDMSQDEYNAWHDQSRVIWGVRMGPAFPNRFEADPCGDEPTGNHPVCLPND